MVPDKDSSGSELGNQSDQPGVDRPVSLSDRSEQITDPCTFHEFENGLCLTCKQQGDVSNDDSPCFDCSEIGTGKESKWEPDEEPQKPETD